MAKVYVDKSTIPKIGQGLFALKNIKKNSMIVEFKGVLHKSKGNIKTSRSNVYFYDGYVLECFPDDYASYANDAINFTGRKRKLMKTLKSSKPFYKKHKKAIVNAEIRTNDKTHRAFLFATTDIKKNEEIFCHYGFMYWFNEEKRRGFLQEDEIDKYGFPVKIFKYPAFISYVKLFFPDYESHEIESFIFGYDFIIKLKGRIPQSKPSYYIIHFSKFV